MNIIGLSEYLIFEQQKDMHPYLFFFLFFLNCRINLTIMHLNVCFNNTQNREYNQQRKSNVVQQRD